MREVDTVKRRAALGASPEAPLGILAFRILLFISVVVLFAQVASADSISYVGNVAGAGETVTAYGTDGYDLYGTTPTGTVSGSTTAAGPFGVGTRLTALPSYITSVSASSSNRAAAGYGYAVIDNPSGGKVESGLTFASSSNPVEADLLTVAVGVGAPSTFYIGTIENIDTASFDYPDLLRLRQTAGGVADSGLVATAKMPTGNLDLYLFKISGAAVGDAFTLSAIQKDNNGSLYNAGTAGLLFTQDSITAAPLPSPFFAGLALMAYVGSVLARRHLRNP